MAFVVVQHLAPDHEGLSSELLRPTSLGRARPLRASGARVDVGRLAAIVDSAVQAIVSEDLTPL